MNVLEETKKKAEEKMAEYKELTSKIQQVEKDLIYLEGQMSVLSQLKFEEEKEAE